MIQSNMKGLLISILFFSNIFFTSCNNKAKNTTTNADTASATVPAPVQISPDDSLQSGVRDAVKDYPKVNASVSSGEITLTGEISRERLPKLMESLNSLRPKKINNNLTIK